MGLQRLLYSLISSMALLPPCTHHLLCCIIAQRLGYTVKEEDEVLKLWASNIRHNACIRCPVNCSIYTSSFEDFANFDLKFRFLFLTGMIEENKKQNFNIILWSVSPTFSMDIHTAGAGGTSEFFQELQFLNWWSQYISDSHNLNSSTPRIKIFTKSISAWRCICIHKQQQLISDFFV